MVVKWIFKAMISLVAAIIVLLFPHKVAGIAVAILGSLWDIAVTIGRSLHVPGTKEKAAMILPWLGFISPRNLLAPLTPQSKENN